MKRLILAAIACLPLFSCGPKEIGEGMSVENVEASQTFSAEAMREPVTGLNPTQRMLYYYNRPDIMEKTQNWRLSQYRRALAPSPEDPAYRAVPRQASPFRQ